RVSSLFDIFFLLTLSPSRSTLFPYTTLFRSTYQGLCGGVDSVADYRQCVPDDPHGYITDFEAPVAGELVVRIAKGPWQGGPYEPAATFMAGNMMLKIASYSNDVDLLTVITPDGETHTVEYAPSGYTDTTREPTV